MRMKGAACIFKQDLELVKINRTYKKLRQHFINDHKQVTWFYHYFKCTIKELFVRKIIGEYILSCLFQEINQLTHKIEDLNAKEFKNNNMQSRLQVCDK